MFKHRVDPEVQKQIDELRKDYKELANSANTRLGLQGEHIRNLTESLNAVVKEYAAIRADLDAIEQKLDELLKAQDASARSIPGEEPKPEAPNVMPGHIPWSQRKRHREQASRSPNFIDKVKKGAATTEKTEEVKNE